MIAHPCSTCAALRERARREAADILWRRELAEHAWRGVWTLIAFACGTLFGMVLTASAQPAVELVVLCVADEQEQQIWCAPVEPAAAARVLAESASQAGGDTESTMGEFAYGNAKGLPFDQGTTEDLEWYLKTQKKKLADEPNGKFARFQRTDIAEIESILRQRANGSGQAIVPAGQTEIVQRPPAEVRKLAGTYSASKARSVLEEAAAIGHLVTPATGCNDLPEGFSIAINVVYVDAAAETYDVGGGKFGLSKSALQKIGVAAGITWLYSARADDASDRHYCFWRVVGALRLFDGRQIQLPGHKEMDLREGSAQIEALFARYEAAVKKYEKEKKEGKNVYPPKDPTAQIREMRLHIAAHAETKAMLRAIRSIGIRSAYTREELRRPFIVASLCWTGRSEDPALAREFALLGANNHLNAAAALYGPPQGGLIAPAPAGPQLSAPPPLRRHLDDDDDLPPGSDSEPPAGASAGGTPPPANEPPGPPPAQSAAATPPAAPPARTEAPTPPGGDAPPPPPPARRTTSRSASAPQPPPGAGDAWEPPADERQARGGAQASIPGT